MKILLVVCHPDPDSFVFAAAGAAEAGLRVAGHAVDRLDLYAEGFDPVMSRTERLAYHTAGANEQPVFGHLARLKAADGLLFVYPTWWYGQPAMLKGWLDRVFVPHATFSMPADNQPIRGLLDNIRFIGVVTTLGSPRWWWWWMGEPGRRILLLGIRALCPRTCRTLWLAQHRMDEIGPEQRKAFLARVEHRMAALR